MKKIICFYGNIYNSFIGKTSGGGELQISYLARGAAKNGLEVYIIDVSETKPDIKIDEINFIFTKNKLGIVAKLLKIKPDFIYGRIRGVNHFAPYLISRYLNSKYILGLAHDLDVSDFKQRFKEYYQDKSFWYFFKKGILTELLYFFVLKHADLIIAQHALQHDKLIKRKINNTVVIPNIFIPQQNIIHLKNLYDYIYVGSLDKRKGLFELAQIVSKLKEKKFLVIGKFRGEQSKQIKDSFLRSNNITYYEKINHQEVFSLINSSKALISSSLSEGFPNVFLEAWSLNKPVFSLWVDPGHIMKTNKLGVCYNGNTNKMLDDLSNFKSWENTPNFQNYLKSNHSYELNTLRFVEQLNKL